MAWAKYFLLFIIISQTSNLGFSAKEGFDDVITQVGIGNRSSLVGTNSNYQNNFYSLLSVLISESSTGFFNGSVGDGTGRAYGWYLCRGDLSPKKCHNCLDKVRQYVLDQPIFNYYSNGILYNLHLQCVLHYANSSRPFVYSENTTFTGQSFGDDLTQYRQYNTTLLRTMQDLSREAGHGNWTKANFATRVVEVAGSNEKIFILVQCTPDISSMNCSNCLSDLYSVFRPTHVGGKILGFNCLLKYNNESFFGSAYRSFMPSHLHVILVLLSTMYFPFM